MAVTSGSLVDIHSDRIEEVLNKTIDYITPSMDPIFTGTILSSEGVGSADDIGRDWKIIRMFQTGVNGVFEQAASRGDFPLYGDQLTSLSNRPMYSQSINQTFPDGLAGANHIPYRLGIGMRAMVGNLVWSLSELTAEAHSAFIGNVLAPKLRGFARNIMQYLCNAFYTNQATYYQLCAISSISYGAEATPGPFTMSFQPDNYAVDRFLIGMLVDIFTSNGATKINDGHNVYVSSVDELTNTVTLSSATFPFDGDSTSGSSSSGDAGFVDNGDIIVHANQNSSGTHYNFAGLNSWVKFGGSTTNEKYLLGDDYDSANPIDVDKYPEHKSMLYSFGGAALTEHVLRQVLRRFHAAKGNKYGYEVDTVIASDGVWLAYEGTRIGREWVDRTNRVAATTSQGLASDRNFGGFTFTMDGRTYRGMTSTYVEANTVYAIKTGGGNWKRYVPPDAKVNKTFDQLKPGYPLRFVAPALTGGSASHLPVFSVASSRTLATEFVQMPCWMRMQLVPTQFCGIKLTNCAEDRIYADT